MPFVGYDVVLCYVFGVGFDVDGGVGLWRRFGVVEEVGGFEGRG